MGNVMAALSSVAAVIVFITPLAGLLYTIFKDSFSPMNRIKQTAETIITLNGLMSADLKADPRWDQRQWIRAKFVMQRRLIRDMDRMGNVKNLWVTWMELIFCALGTVCFLTGTILFTHVKRSLVFENPLLFVVIGALILLIASLLLAGSALLWMRLQNIKLNVNIKEEDVTEYLDRQRRQGCAQNNALTQEKSVKQDSGPKSG